MPTALKELVDDVDFWDKHKTFDIYEIASRLHHKAVQIQMAMADGVECWQTYI